ncbi:MAG: lipase [Pirellulaceae bacterium]|nr:MAG: lipase [Pirellulaceae bacterium]
MRGAYLVALVLIGSASVPAWAQQPQRQRAYPPEMPGAREEVYKRIDGTVLRLYIYEPKESEPREARLAIIFFFGGGWRSGTPAQFYQQCLYLAGRGMVAIAADYRVESRHQATVAQCVADAKSAVRWVRAHARQLGIDPDRIVAAGGSAGGHLAAATALLPGLDEPGEDTSISCRPNALVLFNPAVILAPVEGQTILPADRLAALEERFGAAAEQVSPFHNIQRWDRLPPTLILHGRADTTVPYRTVELFCEAMRKAGADCELIGYEGQPHGFFNYGRGDNRYYRETLEAVDRFLVRLGYLTENSNN